MTITVRPSHADPIPFSEELDEHTITALSGHHFTDTECEQEWCECCSTDDEPYDDVESPGMPRTVIDRHVESLELPAAEWDPAWGPAAQYLVTDLDCGHTLSRLC